MRVTINLLVGLCLAAALPCVSLAQAGQVAAEPQRAPGAENLEAAPVSESSAAEQTYLLGPGDIVEIAVLGRGGFSERVPIEPDGKLTLSLLGRIDASNRTTRQLGEQIAKELETRGFFSKATMRVNVASYASRYVTVLGAVGAPGLIPIDRAYRLSEILARAGGTRESAADYVILRSETGPERRLPLKSVAVGGPSDDPYVSDGDKVFIPPAEVFYMSGQVRSPGPYAVTSGMTLRMAIARSGGLTESGSDRRVEVNRGGQKIKRLELDAPIQPGDVVTVGERIF